MSHIFTFLHTDAEPVQARHKFGCEIFYLTIQEQIFIWI